MCHTKIDQDRSYYDECGAACTDARALFVDTAPPPVKNVSATATKEEQCLSLLTQLLKMHVVSCVILPAHVGTSLCTAAVIAVDEHHRCLPQSHLLEDKIKGARPTGLMESRSKLNWMSLHSLTDRTQLASTQTGSLSLKFGHVNGPRDNTDKWLCG